MHTLVPVGTASNCPVDGSHLGSTERNHVFLRDMIRPAVASYHMTVETFTGGSVARGRNHVIFLSSGLPVLRPFVQLEAVLCTVIYASFGGGGSHMNPLGTQGELANSTQKRPIADPGQGMSTDDMEERTHHTVPTVSFPGIEPRTFLL